MNTQVMSMQNQNTQPNQQTTMSHVEIARLAGKRPDSVKRTMEILQDKGLVTFTQIVETFVGADGKNQKRNTYHVNQRDSYIVMAQVSPEFTAKLVDRWQELEKEKQQQAQQAIPASTGNLMIDALIETQRQVMEQKEELSTVKETVEKITAPLNGVTVDVAYRKLVNGSDSLISKAAYARFVEHYAEETGFYKTSQQRADGQFYPVAYVKDDIEAVNSFVETLMDEAAIYPKRIKGKDFLHIESGIGGQFV